MQDIINHTTDCIKWLNENLGVIGAIILSGIALWFAIIKKIIEGKIEVSAALKKMNKKNYNAFKHDQSAKTIMRVQDQCNFYKDQSAADSLIYCQLENGTTATSELCNLFISALAEDSRMGRIPKSLCTMQRIPYSKLSYWISATQNGTLIIEDVDNLPDTQIVIKDFFKQLGIQSFISSPVYNALGVFCGISSLYYAKENFGGLDLEEQKKFAESFKVSIETIFLQYYLDKEKRKKELKIK